MAPIATDTELLKARIAREQALAGLLNTLRDLVLDLRTLVQAESSKGGK